MPFSVILIPMLIALLGAFILHMTPGGRADVLFSVPVVSGFRHSGCGRAILRRYHLLNWTAAALTGAIGVAGAMQNHLGLILNGPVLQMAVGAILFTRAKSRVEPHAVEPRLSVRRASLRGEPVIAWWGWALMMLPLAMLAGASAYLTQHWDQIPARFPVDWGSNGLASRWADKSAKSVYSTLTVGLSTLLLIYGYVAMVVVGAPRGGRAMNRFVRMTAMAMTCGGLFVAGLMCWIALRPLAANPNRWTWPWIMGIALGASIALALKLSRISDEAAAEVGAPAEGWWLSSFYFNERDPAMMVQRRIGFGFTPNFAHPVVKWAFPLLLMQLFAVVFFVAR